MIEWFSVNFIHSFIFGLYHVLIDAVCCYTYDLWLVNCLYTHFSEEELTDVVGSLYAAHYRHHEIGQYEAISLPLAVPILYFLDRFFTCDAELDLSHVNLILLEKHLD